MSKLEKTITLLIAEKSYSIEFPTIGQLAKIESLQQLHANNTYGAMIRARSRSADRVLDIVDMISHFTILVPELGSKDPRFSNLEELSYIEALPLIKVYKEDLKPWMDNWFSVIEGTFSGEQKSEESEA